MYRSLKIGIAAIVAAGFIATLPSPAQAGTSLKKIGNAIQYPVRKTGENISIATHRAVGNKSVQKSNRTGRKIVITPGGHKKLLHPYAAHRRIVHHHHHRLHHTMQHHM